MSLRLLHQPTITGPKRVRCGRVFFGLPENAGAVQPRSGLLYVLHQARLHVFTESGEVEIPDDLRAPLASRYFGARPAT